MSEYIEKLTKVDIPPGSDDQQELTEAQATSLKSALQRVRWETSQVVPELAVQALNREGKAQATVRPLNI